MAQKKWSCFYCGQDILEGQRFTFLPGKGGVHLECLNKYVVIDKKAIDSDVIGLLDVNESLLYTIIRLKEAEKIITSKEILGEIESIRKEVEKHAGKIVSLLSTKIS